MTSYKTDLKRARGFGAAKHGAGHWLTERLTSAALVPLGLWGIWSFLRVAQWDYAGAVDWVREPLNAVLLVLTLAVSFQHMHAGMRVIIEDYIESKPAHFTLIFLSAAACLLAAAFSIFAVLRVALGGGA